MSKSRERANVIWRVVAIVAVILVVALAIALGVVAHRGNSGDGSNQAGLVGGCEGLKNTPRDLKNPDIFDDLSFDELIAVRDYMIKAMGLRPFDEVRATKNLESAYISSIDLHLPKKSDALKYLDENGSKPTREALVIVIRGDTAPPYIEEYIVGPLPSPSSHIRYKNPSFRRDPIPYPTKFMDTAEIDALDVILKNVSARLYKVIRMIDISGDAKKLVAGFEDITVLVESFGAGYHNCTAAGDCLAFYDFTPRLTESGERTTLYVAFIRSEGYYIRPVSFQLTINHLSTKVSDWSVVNLFYNNVKFDSVATLLAAYDDGTLPKLKEPINKDTQYYSYKKRDHHSMPDKPQMGPRMFEPEGKRYKVTGRQIDYMGWSLNFRSRFSAGLQLFDVKFRGERIAYELSFQEAYVIYAGYDIFETIAMYYDVSWMLGDLSFELMPGVDCPETATYFDMDYFVSTHKPRRNRRSVCVFELNNGMPLRRHFSPDYNGGFRSYSGLPDYQLVVRQAATIWNYDYVFDYVFHLNGAIEVKAASTGYPESTFYTIEEDPYGHKLFKNVFGNMHIHNFHFKADIDILGTSNRYETISLGVETIPNPWFEGKTKTQMKMVREQKTTELQAAYKYDFDDPKYCLFYNKDKVNAYGTKRAYRLKPVGMGKFVLPDSTPGVKAASWTKYQMAVTKHKDHEQASTSVYSQNDPWSPVLNFEDFINDDEGIVDEDLVAWVSLATHHIPHSEDAPSTQTPYMTLNFFLYPYNYFDEDPSTSSSDTVFVEPQDNFKKVKIERYGTSTQPTCMPTEYKFDFNGTSFTD